jgi:WD40 repeat protein
VVAVGGLTQLNIYDIADGALALRYSHNLDAQDMGGLSALAWANSGQWLAVARYDGLIRVVEAETGKVNLVLRGHIGAVNALAVSADDRLIASAGDDLLVRVWSASNGQLLATLAKHRARVTSLLFLPDRLVSGDGARTVLQWREDLASNGAFWQSPATPQGHQSDITALAATETGYASASLDNTIRLWQASGSPQAKDGILNSPSSPLVGITWYEGALWSAGGNGEIRYWGGTQSSLIWQGGPLHTAAFGAGFALLLSKDEGLILVPLIP